jgi:LCP family protein required for cell wall assembly
MGNNTPPKDSAKALVTRKTWAWAAAVFLLTFAGTTGAMYWLLPASREGGFRSMASVMSAMADVAGSPDLVFGTKDYLTVLVVGRDVDRDRRGQVMKTYGRSDTIMVAYFDRTAHKVSLLSIPRDMLMRIPRAGVMKVNAAHSFGGPELLIRTLRDNLCLEVDHWIRVNFEGSVKVVEAMGGVVVEVEKDMNYDDNWGNLHIHLKKGRQLLDGQKAHQYMRFRKDAEADIGRIRRQQQLMRDMAHQLLQPGKLLKLPRIVQAIQGVVDTDMSDSEMMSLAAFMRNVPPDGVVTETLPGHSRNGQWVMVSSAAGELLQKTMGYAFGFMQWRRAGQPRYAGMTIPRAPVPDPEPTRLPEEELATTEQEGATVTTEGSPALTDDATGRAEPPVLETPSATAGETGATGRGPETRSVDTTPSETPSVTPPDVPPIGTTHSAVPPTAGTALPSPRAKPKATAVTPGSGPGAPPAPQTGTPRTSPPLPKQKPTLGEPTPAVPGPP